MSLSDFQLPMIALRSTTPRGVPALSDRSIGRPLPVLAIGRQTPYIRGAPGIPA
jgi:hypothetical protein